MGVCTVERPVMHWQQSARFLGPPRERSSPTLPGSLPGQCHAVNNNHLLHRPCASCPTDLCEHNTKTFGPSPIFNDSCRSFETPERSVYDESGLNYSDHANNQTECTDLGNGSSGSGSSSGSGGGGIGSKTSCLHLKAEPLGGPSSPESTSELPNVADSCAGCAGCGRSIQDRFYLSAVGKQWHESCLQCWECHQLLDRETSCFSRDGKIYCKTDYYRTFATCSRCMASIRSSELVMRARNLVFHVPCFTCAMCNLALTKGDQFGMRDSQIFCRMHYEITMDSSSNAPTPISMQCQYSQFGTSPNGQTSPSDNTAMKLGPSGYYSPQAPPHGMPGLPQAPRQKGRPRKRKPKDIEAMTASLDLNSEYLDLGFGRGGPLNAASRAKRMRTSFKHHQLRTMKSYFAINHNPDAKDLKQLSQKTGLPKRVLQVWFQNARAKWRRMMMKQEGKGGDKGDGLLDLDSYSHSPPYSMIGVGPPSPNSID